MFAYAERNANMPICYNGDLFTTADLQQFHERFPNINAVMLGRGLLANPGLLLEKAPDAQQLLAFHDTLLLRYQADMPGDRALLFKMKELWVYLGCLFADADKQLKKILKAQKLVDYQNAVNLLFAQCELLRESTFCG